MDWFEVEFEAAARNRLSPERRKDIIDSLREHVQEAKRELFAEGGSEEDAERMAVRRLGAPLDLVRAELDTPKRQWWPVYAALIGMLVLVGGLIYGPTRIPFILELLPFWATPLAVLVLSMCGRRIKLWALFGTTVACSAALLLLLAFTWLRLESAGGMGYTAPWNIQADTDEINKHISTLDVQASLVKKASAAFRANNQAEAERLTLAPGGGWKVPDRRGPESYVNVVYLHSPTYAEARKIWDGQSGKILAAIDEERTRLNAQISAMSSPAARDPRAILSENLPITLYAMILIYAVLAGSHLLGLGLAILPALLARRRWRAIAR